MQIIPKKLFALLEGGVAAHFRPQGAPPMPLRAVVSNGAAAVDLAAEVFSAAGVVVGNALHAKSGEDALALLADMVWSNTAASSSRRETWLRRDRGD